MTDSPEERVEDLRERLREAVAHVDGLRREAAELAEDLRNQIHALALERQALRRLDDERARRVARRRSDSGRDPTHDLSAT